MGTRLQINKGVIIMRKPIKSEKEIVKIAKDYVKSCKMCFDHNSTEHWVQIFAGNRYETLAAVQLDDHENKLPKKYRKIFVETFTAGTMEIIAQKKKVHEEKERQAAAASRARRKKGGK